MKILGLDQSLTKAGVSSEAGEVVIKPNLESLERLDFWYDFGSEIVADLVALENYSYASKYQAHQIGEAVGIVKLAIWRTGIPIVLVSPGQLKMFATGNGNASKVELASHASARSGQVFSSDDEADAYALRQMALAHYCAGDDTCKMAPTNDKHREALANIDWPVL